MAITKTTRRNSMTLLDKLYVDIKRDARFFNKTATVDQPSSANFSPFSTSPSDSDDLQNSCEDLRDAFSQATIHTPLIQPFIGGSKGQYQNQHQLNHQLVEQGAPASIIHRINDTAIANQTEDVSLISMLRHFPDLPTFIYHKDFPVFSEIWIEFQRNALLARNPANRPQVQSWLESAALQIHYTMVTIVKTTNHTTPTDAESQPRRLFSALRRLKDRIEIMYQVFEIIEKGRVLFGQSPSAAIAPLIDAAIKIKMDVSYFSSKHSQVIPVMEGGGQDTPTTINLKAPQEVTMTELSNRVMDTYNLMPYKKSITTAANNLFVRSAAADTLPSVADGAYFDTPITRSTNTTSYQPVASCASPSSTAASAIYVQENNHSHQNYISLATAPANQNESFHQPTTTNTNEPTTMNHRVPLYSHIQPSWIHYASSVPVTPSAAAEHKQLYLSLPTSPTCINLEEETSCSPTPTVAENACTPCNTVADPLSYSPSTYHQNEDTTNNSPLNTISDDSSDYDHQEQQQQQYDEDMDIDIEDFERLGEDQEEDMLEVEEDDDKDEYVISDDGQDEDWKEEKRRCFRRRSTRRSSISNKGNYQRSRRRVTQQQQQRQQVRIGRHYTRRTATSYDAQTTHYLKSIFFDIYSSRDKLTKDQRRQVQKQTGLKPRNITYWFSNHKRRFQNSLLVFKKVVKESKGAVKTYDDFLNYRKEHGLPEEVHEDEYLDLEEEE